MMKGSILLVGSQFYRIIWEDTDWFLKQNYLIKFSLCSLAKYITNNAFSPKILFRMLWNNSWKSLTAESSKHHRRCQMNFWSKFLDAGGRALFFSVSITGKNTISALYNLIVTLLLKVMDLWKLVFKHLFRQKLVPFWPKEFLHFRRKGQKGHVQLDGKIKINEYDKISPDP